MQHRLSRKISPFFSREVCQLQLPDLHLLFGSQVQKNETDFFMSYFHIQNINNIRRNWGLNIEDKNEDGDVTADNDTGGDEEASNGIEDNDLFHVCWRVCFGKPPAALAAQCYFLLTCTLFISFFVCAD